jgi:hypothetical protein
VIDACIRLLTVLGDALRSGAPIRAVSLDLAKTENPSKTAVITLDLLSKAPEIGTVLEKMSKNTFLAFQLPLWISKHDVSNRDAKNSMKLFFASLARCNPSSRSCSATSASETGPGPPPAGCSRTASSSPRHSC